MYWAQGSQEVDASEASPVLRELNLEEGSPERAHRTVQIQTEGDVDVRTKLYDSLFSRMSQPDPKVPGCR